MTEVSPKKKSDLGVRMVSAIVMVAVAAVAFALGGMWLDVFLGCVALVAFIEFVGLVIKATNNTIYRVAALVVGLIYLGLAITTLITAHRDLVFLIVGSVVAVDTFAYFVGRKFGGPKIAPSISPSKTWSGLVGGVLGASSFVMTVSLATKLFYDTHLCRSYYDYMDSFEPRSAGIFSFDDRCHIATATIDLTFAWQVLLIGFLIAVVAQAGDFLESWIKRRAGAKDSGSFIPGHGGVLDRADGMVAVAFVFGLINLAVLVWNP
ncbi:MAG: phosphatidate cytidylyltransferase [Sphingorhabdus sp.]